MYYYIIQGDPIIYCAMHGSMRPCVYECRSVIWFCFVSFFVFLFSLYKYDFIVALQYYNIYDEYEKCFFLLWGQYSRIEEGTLDKSLTLYCDFLDITKSYGEMNPLFRIKLYICLKSKILLLDRPVNIKEN